MKVDYTQPAFHDIKAEIGYSTVLDALELYTVHSY